MGWVRQISLLLLFISLSSAFVVELNDSPGASNVSGANSSINASEKCNGENVQAVYQCLGNVVRVVSSVPGEGSTFYKPEGKVIHCPVVQPSQMGAECLSLMGPNFCPEQEICGESPAPEVFPGQNGTPEQTGDEDYYIVEGKGASENASTPEPPSVVKPQAKKTNATAIVPNDLEVPGGVKNNLDWPLSYLAYVALFLGFASVFVLFLLFKNSLTEEEL